MRSADWSDEGQNYLATVSDLMAGLIFLFLITLMIFVLRYQSATQSIQSAEATRALLLETLRDSLQERDLQVEIDVANGVLRLTEQSINFPSGSTDPLPAHEDRIRVLSEVLASVLPCFVPDPVCQIAKPDELDATVQALMIEGHTDVQNLHPLHRLHSNLELSGARAATIHSMLIETEPGLDSLRNRTNLKILSISGYGSARLLDSANPNAVANRRIDLRFIMEPPAPDDRLPQPAEETQSGLEEA